jgi:energy-coupling factor transport system ATP-binding protein
VVRLARRVVVLHAGRILADASPAEVYDREDELRSIGLGLPQAAQLVRDLRRRGVDVGDALTMPQARHAILAALRGDRRGAD